MKRNDIFPSRFLKAADLGGKVVVVTVERVVQEELDEQLKAVVYFHGSTKPLVLNATNYDSIAEHYGEDTDGWPDAEIEVYPTKVQFKGKLVPCIRVRMPQRRPDPLGADANAAVAAGEPPF